VRKCIIRQSDRAVPLCGDVCDTPWETASAVRIDRYPWYRKGLTQSTTVRLLYSSQAMFVQFRCRDRHSFAEVTALNGPVCEDSCVEFFSTLDPDRAPDYFNLEVNCCGVLHVGFGAGRHGRCLIHPTDAAGIRVATSLPGTTKAESAADRSWWVALEIPFRVIEALSGQFVRPRPGRIWRGNFYRCGGRTDAQYACWNPVESPTPDYHRPECFGQLHFA
jgi:cellulose/xylan binding protein with CBM9 domain